MAKNDEKPQRVGAVHEGDDIMVGITGGTKTRPTVDELDAEIAAMSAMKRALQPLDGEARIRTLNWLMSYYGILVSGGHIFIPTVELDDEEKDPSENDE